MRVLAIFQKAICIFVSMCLLASPAFANMNQVMDQMFNSMMNVTPGQVYQTQTAGVIAGPSLYVRNKISTVRPLTFDPPHLKVGCNGIDAYAGAFTFVSKDALINLMRNIASNALPYAFQIAIGALCPKCQNLMSELQKVADAMNKFNINSCKAAQGPLQTLQTLRDSAEQLGEAVAGTISVSKSIFSDFNEAINDPVTSATAALREADPATAGTELEYNTAWRAIAGSNIARWYINTMSAAGATSFNETVMSFTGSIITRFEDSESAGKQETITLPLGSLLSFDDFLRGNRNVNLWRCSNAVKCLRPDLVEGTMPSIRDEVEFMLFGAAGTPGIIDLVTQRQSNGGVYLSVDQQRFVEAAPGAIYANLKNLSANPNSARVYANSIADWLAVEMTAHLLLDILRNVKMAAARDTRAPNGGRDPGVQKFLDELRNKELEVYEARRAAAERMGGLQNSLQLAALIRQNLNQSLSSSARPSLAQAR